VRVRLLWSLLAAWGSLTACLGPLPHPVTLTDFGHIEVGVAVQTIGSGLQLDGMAQVGVLPHLQLELQGGIDVWTQWQLQAGLRGEVPLGDSDGLQLAALFSHQTFEAGGCEDSIGPLPVSGCEVARLNEAGGELGWAHRFGSASSRRLLRPAFGLFLGILGGNGSNAAGSPGNLWLIEPTVGAELPIGTDGLALLVGGGASIPAAMTGGFAHDYEQRIISFVASVGLLFRTGSP
jgi:hypothetical protein